MEHTGRRGEGALEALCSAHKEYMENEREGGGFGKKITLLSKYGHQHLHLQPTRENAL